MRRYLVAAAALVPGIALATAYLVMRGDPGPRRDAVVFDACILLFTATYNAGHLIYWFLGDRAEGEVLARWSWWHEAVLNAAGSLFFGRHLLDYGASPGQRLLLAWGLVLLVVAAIRAGLRLGRGRRSDPGQGRPGTA